jgi:hypothetical protein
MAFKTEHNLIFEVAEWPLNLDEGNPWHKFRIGTCEGLWRDGGSAYEILAIVNSTPNNGHLIDVFQWFEHSCKRDKKSLKIIELLNDDFKKHLIKKQGFKKFKDGVIKYFK